MRRSFLLDIVISVCPCVECKHLHILYGYIPAVEWERGYCYENKFCNLGYVLHCRYICCHLNDDGLQINVPVNVANTANLYVREAQPSALRNALIPHIAVVVGCQRNLNEVSLQHSCVKTSYLKFNRKWWQIAVIY